MKPGILFHYTKNQRFFFPRRKVLKKFLADIFKREGFPIDTINYIFCSDKFLLKINREFLKHNFFTDVISFQFSETGQPIVAEIYISVERVRYSSKLFGSTFLNELHRVIFHGTLHLCGYSDKNMRSKTNMKSREDFYLVRYSCSREIF